MRLFCWNINALVPTIPNFRLTHGSVRGFFDSQKADVVCFQETKLLSEEKLTEEAACVEDFESFWTFSRDKKGYSGVATYVARQFSPVTAHVDCLGNGDEDIDREGRCVVTDLGAFVLINVYAPNAGDRKSDNRRIDVKIRFLEALKRKADVLRDAGKEVIIVGDLNVAASQADVHSKLTYERMYSKAEKEALQALLSDYTDIWRRLHPDVNNVFTVWDEKTSARVFNEGVRIDYTLLSPGLLQHVVSCEVISNLPPKWSDHAALLLELKDIPSVQPHLPCALSSLRMKRFAKPKASITSMFAKHKAAPLHKAHDDSSVAPNPTQKPLSAKHNADDSAGGALHPTKRAKSDSVAAEVQRAAVSAPGMPSTSQAVYVGQTAARDREPPGHVQGSKAAASASMQVQRQPHNTAAGEETGEVEHKHASMSHEDQNGTSELAAELPSDNKLPESAQYDGGRTLPVNPHANVSRQSQAKSPYKSKSNRVKSSVKAGAVQSDAKQKCIRGFFTVQQ